MYDLVLGKKEQWEHRLVQGLPDRCKLSEPVGLWFTEFGHLNRGTFTGITFKKVDVPKYISKHWKFKMTLEASHFLFYLCRFQPLCCGLIKAWMIVSGFVRRHKRLKSGLKQVRLLKICNPA